MASTIAINCVCGSAEVMTVTRSGTGCAIDAPEARSVGVATPAAKSTFSFA